MVGKAVDARRKLPKIEGAEFTQHRGVSRAVLRGVAWCNSALEVLPLQSSALFSPSLAAQTRPIDTEALIRGFNGLPYEVRVSILKYVLPSGAVLQ